MTDLAIGAPVAGAPMITLREIMVIVFRHRFAFAVAFFCVALPLALLPYSMKHQYMATASILINSGPEFNPQGAMGGEVGTPPYLTKQEIINSELAILGSRDLAVETINKIGLDKIYPGIAAHPPAGMSMMDSAVQKFTHDFKATPVTESEVIYLEYYNTDRNIALQTISTMLAIYGENHATIFGNSNAPYIASQLQTYESQLNKVATQIADLRQQKSLFNIDDQTTQAIQDRSEAVAVLNSLQSKSADAHGRIAYYQERLRVMPPLVEAGQTQSDSVDTAKSNLLDLQVQLQKLKQRYTQDVKPVQDAEQQIETVRSFIAGKSVGTSNVWMERNPAYDDATLKLQQSEADATSMDAQIVLERQDLEALDNLMNNLVAGGQQLETLDREHQMLNSLVLTTRTRYEDAKASEFINQGNTGSVNIISSPSASTKYAKPKHKLFILVGFALGLMVDAALLLYFTVGKETLITSESVERLLGIKVLGAIPDGATT